MCTIYGFGYTPSLLERRSWVPEKHAHLSPSRTRNSSVEKWEFGGNNSTVSVFNRDLNFVGFPDKPPGSRIMTLFRRYIIVLTLNDIQYNMLLYKYTRSSRGFSKWSEKSPLHPEDLLRRSTPLNKLWILSSVPSTT